MDDTHAGGGQGVQGRVGRREFLRVTAAGAAGVAAWSVLGQRGARAAATSTSPPLGPASKVVRFDTGWLFGVASVGSDQPGFDDSGFQTVELPHTVTKLSWQEWDPATWEKVWAYRKHFDAPADASRMRVFADFAAAMTKSSPVLNGHALPGRAGGYLPFTAELTDYLRPRGNVLAMTLDSRFNIDVPPDRPAPYASNSVDYWQPGGIYREVRLRAVPQVFVADVFAKPVNVLDPATRKVDVQVTADAAVVPQGRTQIVVDLRDGARKVASASVPVTFRKPGQMTVTATLTGLGGITLWDTGNPKLYTVVATLIVNGSALHDYQTRIGFREASFRLDGFFLNGRRVKVFGVNRHQFFPFAGGAMPARVQRRDAEILRNELNCNMVRCSHYPQHEAFYDACDELGLMVWEEIPGWGYFGDAAWQAAMYRDVGDMVVRDRNHPAVIVWGAMPNEAGEHATAYTANNRLAHSLDDSRPTGGDGRRTDASFVFDVFSRHDYSHTTGPSGLKEPTLQPPTDAVGKPYLVCEAVGTLSGPAEHYRRTDPQEVQQGQAAAHARVHDISFSDDRYCGLLAWSGYDYDSGNGNEFGGVKYTGVVDLFRIPKPGAAIYQAQVDPKTRPVIAPAFYWDFGPSSPVTSLPSAMICSNLDRLEVYVAGKHFATVTPDTASYGHLPYPPSFADFSKVDGSTHPELRIDGYLGSSKAASRSFSSDHAADRLSVKADDSHIAADGVDETRVVFRATDAYGNPRPYVGGQVNLTLDGPARLVGDNPFAFAEAGGVGAVWVRSLPHSPGTVTLRADHPQLGSGSATVSIRPTSGTGPPAPYGTLMAQAAPSVVTAGGSTTLTAAFTNHGLPLLDTVTLSADAPAGWAAAATTAVTFHQIKPGQTVRATWRVTAPARAKPGQAAVTTQASYTANNQRGVTDALTSLLIPYASLAAAFNNTGISDDSNVDPGNFDGVGDSYSAQLLAAGGFVPDKQVQVYGMTFTWPSVPAGQPDNALAEGQTIPLSGSGTALGFLGAGSPGDEGGSGTVHYTDGSTSTFNVVLDNWWYAPRPENRTALSMRYLNSSGVGWRPHGQRDHTVYLFYTSVPLTAGKTVRAVTLPTGGSNSSNSRVQGMHIFAMAIGG